MTYSGLHNTLLCSSARSGERVRDTIKILLSLTAKSGATHQKKKSSRMIQRMLHRTFIVTLCLSGVHSLNTGTQLAEKREQ